MAVDEAIMTLHGQGKAPRTLRFYAWSPACLSVGYFQAAIKEIDVGACAAQGIDFVRRPTGGRAVLHDQELTYSVIASEADDSVSGGVADSFRKISAGIVEGFRRLGLAAEIGLHRPEARSTLRTPACFDAASQHEVTFSGRKLVGSAQCRKGGVILQQGSIPLALDAGRLFSVFKTSGEDGAGLRQFEERVLPLRWALGRQVEVEDVAQALLAGFETALGPLIGGSLTQEEEALARDLVARKYGNPEWNLKR